MNFFLVRKHLYPGGPNTYPTIAQKHFNAAVLCKKLFRKSRTEESVILARWLQEVCLQEAERYPDNEHFALSGLKWFFWGYIFAYRS